MKTRISQLPGMRSGWLAVLASLGGLSLCVLAALALDAPLTPPGLLDRYFPATVGQASLYRYTNPDGSQGLVSVNDVPPDPGTGAYVAPHDPGGTFVQEQDTLVDASGQSQVFDSYYERSGERLVQLAFKSQGQVDVYTASLPVWSPELLQSGPSRPLTGDTVLQSLVGAGQLPQHYRLWLDGTEAVTLPDGGTAQALRLAYEAGQPNDAALPRTLEWRVPDIGLVRSEEYDASGRLVRRTELLNSTRLARTPAGLPVGAVLTDTQAAESLFREDAARTGAHPDVTPTLPFKVAYRLKLDAGFVASPAFADGALFVADQQGRVTALDAAQGSVRWRFEIGAPVTAAPAVAGGLVYVGASDKALYALDARNGLFVWQFRTQDNLAASPVVGEGLVFVASEDQTLYALDARTGLERWRFSVAGRLVAAPAFTSGQVVLGDGAGWLYALDSQTGHLLWRTAVGTPIEANPVIATGEVYLAARGIAGQNGLVAALNLTYGTIEWTASPAAGRPTAPAVEAGELFVGFGDNTLRAFDRATGHVYWQWHLPDAGAAFVGAPLLLGGQMVIVDNSGTLFVLAMASGQLLQRLDLGADTISASPSWGGDTLFITALQSQQVFALRAGPAVVSLALQPLWQDEQGLNLNVNDTPHTAPVLSGGSLSLVTYGGDLWEVNADTGRRTQLMRLGEAVEAPLALDGRRLYVGTVAGHVDAVDLDRRQMIWQSALSGPVLAGLTAADGRVYAHTLAGQVYALDAATGASVWQFATPGRGNSTPVLAAGRLIVSGGALFALEPATGRLVWGPLPFIAIGGLAAQGDVVYAAGIDSSGKNALVAIDAATGQTQWSSPLLAAARGVRPTFDPDTNTVFAAETDGRLAAVSAGTGQVRWRFQAEAPAAEAVRVQAGAVYFSTNAGVLEVVDAATGRLLTNFRPHGALTSYGAPVVQPDRVYALAGHDLYALEIQP